MHDKLMKLIDEINGEFKEIIGGTFVRLDTGELFTKAEVDKYATRKIELFSAQQLSEIKDISQEILGVQPEQHLYNKRSKKVKSNNKIKFDNGDFNIAYKNTDILMELINMKLEVNEKLVYYVLRDFISFPSNSVLINGEVPTMTDLEPLIGLKERTIRKALKTLEEKGLVKLMNSGVRKCIFFNPFYFASGKELDSATLKMFELLECNEDKVEEYIKSKI
jgi:DNA-binding transcriptional ArsR family regulator